MLAMSYYVGYNVVYMFSCYISGVLADRLPKNWMLAGGYALAVVPAVALLLPGDPFLRFGLAFGFAGLYMGVWETVESTTAATLLPQDIRGSGFGLLDTVNGLGDLISSIAVGILWAKVSPAAAMGFVIVTMPRRRAVVIGELAAGWKPHPGNAPRCSEYHPGDKTPFQGWVFSPGRASR